MNETYAERIKKVIKEESKKPAFVEKNKFNMTEDEERYAIAMIHLKSNEDFKIFMEFEAKIIGERMGDAFRLPSKDILDTDDYAVKMAFNHGRYYQMRYFMNSRNLLQKLYLEKTEKERKAKNGKD